ncbi:MAG: pyrimidine/purine nucleoside phosphorylase [Acidiferrobacterales bacterium]|jgi:uncharacterized protein YaiE (UPF0345 family)|nr:pyrimidine/purine nucleoside phosphorylase [Acidiferrobacterales bacterium]
MSEFENVSVVRNANIYFDGGVTSRTIRFPGGEVKTLGIIQPGEYSFETDKKEVMDIQSGEVEVLLPDESEWHRIKAGETFEVKANATFRIKALSLTDYCCSFVD